MNDANFIKQFLHLQGLPAYHTDIPFIQNILYTMKQAQVSLQPFTYLNIEVPITVVDKELMR